MGSSLRPAARQVHDFAHRHARRLVVDPPSYGRGRHVHSGRTPFGCAAAADVIVAALRWRSLQDTRP
ncbi:MAG: hypothetical protein D6725_13010 [Planctomycetota bacterium]|nr:MAG: hypothetical protein D6725_13010 [Planctomycetota bacterium]